MLIKILINIVLEIVRLNTQHFLPTGLCDVKDNVTWILIK